MEKISVRQFTIIVIIFVIGSSILVSPSALAHHAKEDAWISAFIGVAFGMLLVPLYCSIAKAFPNKMPTEYTEVIFGKWMGKLISFIFIMYFFMIASLLLREIGDFMTTQVMPQTPIQSIMIVFLLVIIMGVRLGVETFVRASEIFFPWVIGLIIFLIILLIPEIDIKNIQPVMGQGVKPVLLGLYSFLGIPIFEISMLLMILPHVNDLNRVKISFYMGIFIGGVILVVITLLAILVLGADFTIRNTYPSYVLAKKINIGDFLQRIEIVVAIIWFLTIYFKLVLSFYSAVVGVAHLFHLKEYKFLTLPLGMILVVLSIIISPNFTYFHNIVSKYGPLWLINFGVLLPTIMWGIIKMRRLHR